MLRILKIFYENFNVYNTLEEMGNYITKKINEKPNFVTFSFFDLRITLNLSAKKCDCFITLTKNKLENLGYNTYFTGDMFTYEGETKKSRK